MADLIERDHAAQAIEAYLCNQCGHDTDCDPECIACPHLDGAKILKSVPTVNRWIPCSERLPEPLQNVIVCTDIKTVTLAWLMDDNWYFADTGNGHIEQWGLSDVTHWMLLPEPPKAGDL